MKLIKLIWIFLLFSTLNQLVAQGGFGSNDLDDIQISTIVINKTNIPGDNMNIPGEILNKSEADLLETRLQQALTINGVGGRSQSYTFILYPVVNAIVKEMTATAPTLYLYNVDVSLYVSDYMNSTIYGSHLLNLKGSGKSEIQAYMNAFKNLDPKNKRIQSFITESKQKIYTFINSNCEHYLNKARTFAAQGTSTTQLLGSGEVVDGRLRAISQLAAIPFSNDACFEAAQSLLTEIYKDLKKEACQNYVNKAKVALANKDYSLCARYLLKIPPDAPCNTEVDQMVNKIKDYNDEDVALALKLHQMDYDLEHRRIEAIETMGKAYFKALAIENRNEATKTIINQYDLDD